MRAARAVEPVRERTAATAVGAGAPGALQLMDVLRGLAAAYVMSGHALQYLWAGRASLGGQPFLVRALGGSSVLLGFGHKAVILFFIISGFCIHYRQASVTEPGGARKRLDLRNFAFRRFRRLYPPLLLALLLTAALDRLGSTVNPGYYGGHMVGADAYHPGVVIGNLLMQADFIVRHMGSNVPLWSLTFEFWFYVAYPLMLLLIAWRGPVFTLKVQVVLAAVGLGVLLLVPYSWPAGALSYWVIWGLGAILAERYAGRVSSLPRLLPVLGLGFAAAAWLLTRGLVASDVLVAAVFLAALVPALRLVRTGPSARTEAVLTHLAPLGHMSYSLYLTHFPVIFLLAALWTSSHHGLPRSPWLAAAGAAGALGVAYAAYLLVERHFMSRQRVLMAVPPR